MQTVCQGFLIKKCIRSDTACPDCTNETLVTGKTSESYKTKKILFGPNTGFSIRPRGHAQDPVQDGQIRNSAESPGQGRGGLNSTNERNSDVPIPNWLNVWSDEQISDWQQKDLDIKTSFRQILFLSSSLDFMGNVSSHQWYLVLSVRA